LSKELRRKRRSRIQNNQIERAMKRRKLILPNECKELKKQEMEIRTKKLFLWREKGEHIRNSERDL
jgi:hypothetical protein